MILYLCICILRLMSKYLLFLFNVDKIFLLFKNENIELFGKIKFL